MEIAMSVLEVSYGGDRYRVTLSVNPSAKVWRRGNGKWRHHYSWYAPETKLDGLRAVALAKEMVRRREDREAFDVRFPLLTSDALA